MNSDGYNDTHRAFLQALFSRSTITWAESQPILSAIFTAETGSLVPLDAVDFQLFTDYVQTINVAISPLNYEIRHAHPQKSSTRDPKLAIYSLVNTTSDPQTAMATLYSADEMAFIRRLIDAMFDKNNTPSKEIMAIKVTEAIRLGKVARTMIDPSTEPATNGEASTNGVNGNMPIVGQATSLTMDRAEKMIDGLVEDEWFDRSTAGYLSLSTKSLMELGQWLVETYNDPGASENEWQRIKACEGCKQIVTMAFYQGQDSRPCPKCRVEWSDRNFVGERAMTGMGSVPSRTNARGR